MRIRTAIALLAAAGVLGVAGLAAAGIPNLDNSSVTSANAVPVSIMLCPLGDGDAFTAAQVYGSGTTTDATITVTLLDINFDPVVGYPETDVWFESPGLCYCVDGNIADGPSDSAGQMFFQEAPNAGGCNSGSPISILVNGGTMPVQITSISMNSPDLTCDLAVNLSDLTIYAQTVATTPGAYCIDYYWDGSSTLSDLIRFAQHSGHACP